MLNSVFRQGGSVREQNLDNKLNISVLYFIANRQF